MNLLEHSWARAWEGLGAQMSGDAVRSALIASYSEQHRSYHTLQHLTECLTAFDIVGELPIHAVEVEIALWFHDAIYDLKASDNEEMSAKWASTTLNEAQVQPDIVDRVHALIMTTKHSAIPVAIDEQVLVDIDLAILGAAAPRFAEYEQQIRSEYAFVPGWLFNSKRKKILQSFLDRPRIYSTPHFRALLEDSARANLRRAIGS